MQVFVTFRHIQATAALRRHAETKIDKLLKYLHRPIDAHVILSVDKHRHSAEIILNADHLTLTSTEETADLYSAIDLAVGKLERQVKKQATKRQSRKHLGGNEAVPTPPAPSTKPRVRTERVAVEQMTLREAIRRATAAEAEVLLFQNAASETLNVLHRRKDGSYVLLEPEDADR